MNKGTITLINEIKGLKSLIGSQKEVLNLIEAGSPAEILFFDSSRESSRHVPSYLGGNAYRAGNMLLFWVCILVE